MKVRKNSMFILCLTLLLTACTNRGVQISLDQYGNEGEHPHPSNHFTFQTVPVSLHRETPVSFVLPNQETHWYEVVYLPEGGVNWVEAKSLAEQAGGYLVSLHSAVENDFVFNLIKDRKYWFQWDSSHNHVMHGPFIGAFQPKGSAEPKGGWKWISGEPWTFDNWCQDGVKGDHDPRTNDQPNDATGNQNVAAYGEVNDPVSYWGDFPHKLSSYNDIHPAKNYGFIIEYNQRPNQ